jgi:hypothetical protein
VSISQDGGVGDPIPSHFYILVSHNSYFVDLPCFVNNIPNCVLLPEETARNSGSLPGFTVGPWRLAHLPPLIHCTVGSYSTDGVRGFTVKTPHLRPHCAMVDRPLIQWWTDHSYNGGQATHTMVDRPLIQWWTGHSYNGGQATHTMVDRPLIQWWTDHSYNGGQATTADGDNIGCATSIVH